MLELTEKRKQKILEEVKYYSGFSKFYSKGEWDNFLDFLEKGNNLENMIEATNSFNLLKLIIQYFYSHVGDNGECSRFYDVMDNDEFMQNYRYYFERVRRDFVHLLLAHHTPYFFIDVDNTLTVNGVLSEEKKEYIKNFKYKDHIVLTTGRLYSSIKDIMKDCGIENNYYACLNGSIIGYLGKSELLYKLGEVSKEISKELINEDIQFVFYYENSTQTPVKLNKENLKALEEVNEVPPVGETKDFENVVKILLFINEKDVEKENKVREIIQKYQDIICVRTGDNFFEIMNKNQNKGTAVFEICNRNNLYFRCSVGVGDSMNDYQMLKYTGKSYIVSTASEEMKAHHFAQLENDREHDIIHLLKKYE